MRRHTRWTHELPNGNEVELPVTPTDWLKDDIEVVEKPDGNYLVGYLVHDDDCMNPLDDGDGMGDVHHHPRSHYGSRDSDYYEALGLDSHGDAQYDEDKLQEMWHAKVMALSLQDFYISPELREHCSAEDLQNLLADEPIVGDHSFWANADSAWGSDLQDADKDEYHALIDQVEDELSDWNYEAALEECRVPGDKYAVLLDVYDHSGRSYSVSGSGTQCRWDTSSGEAVWVADSYAREEIDRRAKVYAFGEVVERGYRTNKKYAACRDIPPWLEDIGEFTHWHEASKALEAYAEGKEATPEMLDRGFERALMEVAEQCVEQYDSWQQGDCYGVVSFECTPEGEIVGDDDTCWGYVGREWAEQELKERLTIREEKEPTHA